MHFWKEAQPYILSPGTTALKDMRPHSTAVVKPLRLNTGGKFLLTILCSSFTFIERHSYVSS